jgi:hypothetical protein
MLPTQPFAEPIFRVLIHSTIGGTRLASAVADFVMRHRVIALPVELSYVKLQRMIYRLYRL